MINFIGLRWVSTSSLQSSLSTFHCQKSASSPILYFVCDRWERIQTQLGRIKLNGIRRTMTSGIESHRRHADGVQVESIPRIQDVGYPRRDSKINGRFSSVNLSISSIESSSCQCFMTLHGKKRKYRKVFQNSIKVAKYARRFLAVVGHSWDLDQKRNGTGPTLINQTEIGTELQK